MHILDQLLWIATKLIIESKEYLLPEAVQLKVLIQ